MSKDGAFIVKFIAGAARKDMTAIDAAKEEITDIDKKLHEAESLKLRRMKLILVLDHFGDDSYRRKRNVSVPSSEDIGNESEEFKLIRDKIMEAVGAGPLTIRELIVQVGSYDQDALIIRAVKSLGDDQLVSRDGNGRVQIFKES